MKRLIFNSLTAATEPQSIDAPAAHNNDNFHNEETVKKTYENRRKKKINTAIFTGNIKKAVTALALPSYISGAQK